MSRADFDLLLRKGQERERAFEAIATDDIATVEVKDEHRSRTHVFIEHECYGKPSGIAITKAKYWVIEVRRGWWIWMPTEDMKMLHRAALDRFGVSHGGDGGLAFGAAVPKKWLVNLQMWLLEWRCHGHRWELIPSRRFPERVNFRPICPTCGQSPRIRWTRLDRD